MASATKRVRRAAQRAETRLANVSPLLLRILRRSVVGIRREEKKELLGLAGLMVLLGRVERGAINTVIADVADTKDKVRDIVAQKAADNAATAVATIETARALAVTGMTAMGLSAARTATLTAIILALSDSAKAAATKAAEAAARGGGNRVLTKVENTETKKITDLGASIGDLKAAIREEGERLGIHV